MPIEAVSEIQGVLIKNQAIILEPNRQQELEQKGYGEIEKDKLFLKSFESLYLLYTGRLTLLKEKRTSILIHFCKFAKNKKVIF